MFWKFSFPQKQWRILCALSHTSIDILPMKRNLLGTINRTLTWHESGTEVLRPVLLLTAEPLSLIPSGINNLDDWISACWSLTSDPIGPCERTRITPTIRGKTMLGEDGIKLTKEAESIDTTRRWKISLLKVWSLRHYRRAWSPSIGTYLMSDHDYT